MEYQNLFTQVQVVAPIHHGIPLDRYDQRVMGMWLNKPNSVERIKLRFKLFLLY